MQRIGKKQNKNAMKGQHTTTQCNTLGRNRTKRPERATYYNPMATPREHIEDNKRPERAA
jgi:hypothetical protein